MTRVVDVSRNKVFDVYIGRTFGGYEDQGFGNPFPFGGSRTRSIAMFKSYFYDRVKNDPAFKQRVEELRGKTLGCWCKPLSCHGDVIVEYLENNP